MFPQLTPQMPAASFLLPLLGRLLHLIPSLLGLRPVLLRPPQTASGFSQLAPPLTPLAPRLPPFALRRLAFVVSLSNHTRLRRRPGHRPPASCLAPATPGPTRIHSSCPDAPQTTPKCTPPRPKSFLEKTLIRANPPPFAPQTARPTAPASLSNASLSFASCSARMLGHVLG